MVKKDFVHRIMCRDLKLRVYTALTLDTARTITSIHETTPNATVALGRTINAAALLAATLKPGSHQNISLHLSGTGPIKELIAQADARGNIRGFAAHPDADLIEDIGSISFSKTIGAGFLTVTKDLGLKKPYKSITPLLTGELAADIAYYCTTSEQIPSAVILALQLDKHGAIETSGGILIQTFPDTEERIINGVEENIRSMKRPLGELLKENDDIDVVARELLGGAPIEVMESLDLKAACRCTRELLSRALIAFPREELLSMHSENDGVEITCSFCKKPYHFDKDEIQALLNNKSLH